VACKVEYEPALLDTQADDGTRRWVAYPASTIGITPPTKDPDPKLN
jgi:hypothetical protein